MSETEYDTRETLRLFQRLEHGLAGLGALAAKLDVLDVEIRGAGPVRGLRMQLESVEARLTALERGQRWHPVAQVLLVTCAVLLTAFSGWTVFHG